MTMKSFDSLRGGISANADPSPSPDSRDAGHGFRLTAALLLILLAVTGITQYTARFEPGWGARQRNTDQLVWPQQWAFFATESNAHLVTAYRLAADGSLTPEAVPQMSSRDEWGLGSESSAQFIELEMLESKVPANKWVDCAGSTATACLAEANSKADTATTTVDDDFTPALWCGPTVIVRAPSGESTATAGSTPPSSAPPPPSAGSLTVVQLRCTHG